MEEGEGWRGDGIEGCSREEVEGWRGGFMEEQRGGVWRSGGGVRR